MIAVGTPVATATATLATGKPVTTSELNNDAATRLAKLRAHPVSHTMPPGLSAAMSHAVTAFPLRIMIVDNSGSMATCDGSRVVDDGHGRPRSLSCSRWRELSEDVEHIAMLSEALGARTDFHMLNPQHAQCAALSVAAEAWCGVAPLGPAAGVERVRTAMATSPGGTTPLTEATINIVSMLTPHAAALRASGQRVAVIIATDGLPNDSRSFLHAMQALHKLPVWVVVRLCTDDESVVEYWNELDGQLEAPLEVLDDLRSEAKEVSRVNPWLNYASPLHFARMFGLPGHLFDLLDEAAFRPAQLKTFCEELLGVSLSAEPEIDAKAFVAQCRTAQAEMPPVLNPQSLTKRPWLDLGKLEAAARGSKGVECVIM